VKLAADVGRPTHCFLRVDSVRAASFGTGMALGINIDGD
jgi:hypothetical protein